MTSTTGAMTLINFDFLQSNNITHVISGEFFSTLFQPQENSIFGEEVDKVR